MKCQRILFTAVVLILSMSCGARAQQDPGWPRRIVKPGGTLVIYQPQIDEWNDSTNITWRQAFQLAPTRASRLWEPPASKALQASTLRLTWFLFTI